MKNGKKKNKKSEREREKERECGSKLRRSIEFLSLLQKKKKKIIFDSNLNRNFEK